MSIEIVLQWKKKRENVLRSVINRYLRVKIKIKLTAIQSSKLFYSTLRDDWKIKTSAGTHKTRHFSDCLVRIEQVMCEITSRSFQNCSTGSNFVNLVIHHRLIKGRDF